MNQEFRRNHCEGDAYRTMLVRFVISWDVVTQQWGLKGDSSDSKLGCYGRKSMWRGSCKCVERLTRHCELQLDGISERVCEVVFARWELDVETSTQ